MAIPLAHKRFKLIARVSSSNPGSVRPVLERMIAKGSIREEGGEFVIEAEMGGVGAKELNRSLLSALRREERKTRLRAEWVSDDGTKLRFFDYVLKKTTKTGAQH